MKFLGGVVVVVVLGAVTCAFLAAISPVLALFGAILWAVFVAPFTG